MPWRPQRRSRYSRRSTKPRRSPGDRTSILLGHVPHPDGRVYRPIHADRRVTGDLLLRERRHEDLPELPPDALPHWELAKQYHLFDLELGVKITGSGFPLYRGKGAKLQRALISFFLDEAEKAGYEEIIPPLLVNDATARATGQLPDKEGQMYYVEKDDLYLIPTAEVPITNIYRDIILDENDFPVKLTGYTPCFRREAGSYGAHVRGLNRVHQFDKIEIVRLEHPDRSYEALQEMLGHVSNILDQLKLPYQQLSLHLNQVYNLPLLQHLRLLHLRLDFLPALSHLQKSDFHGRIAITRMDTSFTEADQMISAQQKLR